ncbi:ATP-binding protein [Nostoc sp. CHAB 5836]|nr:ATP-binding protein [Nostoc sp. CHAB 5836]
MAIARQIIVEKHGGAIAVESALGEGTTFVMSLPK